MIMNSLKFNGSDSPTVGIELELQIIDKESKKLISRADEIISACENPQIKRELFQSTIEVNSTPSLELGKTRKELSAILKQLLSVADPMGLTFVMSGTHPFTSWEEQEITALPRYQKLIQNLKWPARRMMIYGLHVHVAVPSANHAIYVCNQIAPYLPYLLILSASSPFWGHTNTGLASCRAKIFESLPTAGIASNFKDWPEYVFFIDSMTKAGSIESFRDIWWDVRPHPSFGTVEIRIFDAVPTLDENISLAALTQALVYMLSGQFQSTIMDDIFIPAWLIKENKWRAARYGINAEMISNNGKQLVKATDYIYKLLEDLKPFAKELGNEKDLVFVKDIIHNGPSYLRQLRKFNSNDSNFLSILNSLNKELIRSL